MAEAARPLLDGVRVLDLCDRRAELAGRLLAELGAEVLKIEPPGGSNSRRLPPFDESGGPRHGESLYWAAVAAGKLSAVLDLEEPAGRERLKELASVADILIESAEPGYLDGLGLGYEALAAINPGLIYISVTPYGSDGPKAKWPATELTLEAAGGRLALQGDRDRPPLPVGYPQAAFHAGTQAAADAVIALNERALSGRGQRLDASMQAAIVLTLMNYTGYPSLTGGDPPGLGDDRAPEAADPRARGLLGLCPCADGFVVVTNTSERQLARAMPISVLPALRKAGIDTTTIDDVDWDAFPELARQEGPSQPLVLAVYEAVRAFFRLKTKRELMQWARESDVHLGAVHTTADLLEFPQLQERGYWRELDGYLHPGPSIHPSRSPIVFSRRAPALGQHQERLEQWLRATRKPAAAIPPSAERLGEAFAGIKVADFSWVAVGPITAKALADHGATVVHVESATRVDFVRTLAPFKDNVVGINRSHFFNNLNTSKLGIALNLALPEGRRLARRLADWADVIVENFTPGTMKRLGLDYETLSRAKPELIMISTCLMGQTGPWAGFAGYGPHGAAISGLYGITGWPDRAPCGPVGPYTDVIAPHYAVAALAAAIYERRKSGLGQHIDVSQVESAIHFLEPLILDQTVNGRTARRAGIDSPTACPHAVFPTAGRQRFIAIAVETAQQWRALKSLAPLDDYQDERFDALPARIAAKTDIEAKLAAWTAQQDRYELERRLVEAGVPAAVVQRPTELLADPQLAARGFFQVLEHSEVGSIPFDGLMTRFSAKQRMLHKAAPCVGEDTEYVLREILGLTDDEIADYAATGVFT